MAEPSERDREMAAERRDVLSKVAPLLDRNPWEAVLSAVTDLVLAERRAAREEGRREPRPITDVMVEAAYDRMRGNGLMAEIQDARAVLDAAEKARK